MTEDLSNFYNNNLRLSQDEIKYLCKKTLAQAESVDWFEARQIRISASSDVHRTKSLKYKNKNSLVYEMLASREEKVSAPAMKYGKTHEKSQ